MTDYFTRALDTRDRLIFEAGPFAEAQTAEDTALDIAGTEASAAYYECGSIGTNRYPNAYAMAGVIINRATTYSTADTGRTIYDTAALDLPL